MFHYLGNERLQLWFYSPNVCAAFLVMTALITIGLFLLSARRGGLPARLIGGGLLLAVVAQFVCLALTYSRGGYVAMFAALLGAAVCARRRWNIAFLALFSAIILLTADGGARVQSMANVGDGSIRNRLWAWQGGAGIVARHWAGGVGAPPAAARYYTAWYQPLELEARYYTLVSDPVTIAASYGLFLLFAPLVLAAFLLQQGLRTWQAGRNPLLLYSIAALGGHLVCGIFNVYYRFVNLLWLPACIALLIMCFILHDHWRRRPGWRRSDFWPPLLLPALVCLGLFAYGVWINRRQPFSLEQGQIHLNSPVAGRAAVEMAEAVPARADPPRAVVVSQNLAFDARRIIRPLAENGYRVLAVEAGVGLNGIDVLKEAINSFPPAGTKDEPVYLVAPGREESLVALAAAAEMPDGTFAGVVLTDAPADWPFERLAPMRNLKELSAPLAAVQDKEYLSEGRALEKFGAENGRIVHVLEIPSAATENDPPKAGVMANSGEERKTESPSGDSPGERRHLNGKAVAAALRMLSAP